MSEKQITTKLQLAQKSSNLVLSSLNLFRIPEKVFTIVTLTRLDISNNNVDQIPSSISSLTKLKQFWANQNPIRSVPSDLSKCCALESLDLSSTLVSVLPRELASIHKLNEIRLENCPLSEKLSFCYSQGITALWKYLQRKVDRKRYKEEVFRRLRENIYPVDDPRQVMDLTLNIFKCLKDVDTPVLKMLVHNINRIFPEKIQYADPEKIKLKIQEIVEDLAKREELSELTLKLKSKYPQEDLEKVANMAVTLSQNYDREELETIFKRKMLPENFLDMELPAITMNLTSIKEKHEHQMQRARLAMFSKMKSVYGNGENLEMIQQLADEFSELFATPDDIRKFIRVSAEYLPHTLEDLQVAVVFQNYSLGRRIID
jgi:Leucine-rich repeat (LRR) protein